MKKGGRHTESSNAKLSESNEVQKDKDISIEGPGPQSVNLVE